MLSSFRIPAGFLVVPLASALARLPVVEPPRGWKTAEGQPFQTTLQNFRELHGQRMQMEAFFKMPGVTKSEDGRYASPSSVKHPAKPAFSASETGRADLQKGTLAMLSDGRSEDELIKQIRSANRGLGIKL